MVKTFMIETEECGVWNVVCSGVLYKRNVKGGFFSTYRVNFL